MLITNAIRVVAYIHKDIGSSAKLEMFAKY